MTSTEASGGEGTDADRHSTGTTTISRRSLLGLAGKGVIGVAALSGAGAIGFAWPRGEVKPTPVAAPSVPPQFRSRPDLDPPRMTVTRLTAADDSGYIFLTPSIVPGARGVNEKAAVAAGLGQEGVLMLDQFGRVVWFDPLLQFASNLRVQNYKGAPVLTYWRGQIADGTGKGVGVILDSSYRQIATVRAGNGLEVDLHDFTLTPQGTALVTAYVQKPADLSTVGGKKHGSVLDSVIQEIDVATKRVLFEWHSLDHVALDESHSAPAKTGPFDYFHVNSVNSDGDHHLLISARNTWALYQIERNSGEVTWRLGGKKSDFAMGPATTFAWQHHATRLADQTISLFDDQSPPAVESQSRALILDADEQKKTVNLVHAYTHPAALVAPFEGSAQVLPNGHMFIGWGGEPYFSEFEHFGSLVLDGRFPTNDQSYRAFRMPWTGMPADSPTIAAEADEVGGIAVYASWNGATEVASWQALAGIDDTSLKPIGSVPKSGFETSITVHSRAKFVAVDALDASGHQLGRSNVVHLA
jgi:hypothetical protein